MGLLRRLLVGSLKKKGDTMKTQTIVVNVFLGLFFIWMGVIVHSLYSMEIEERVSSIPSPLGPDISHCFEGDVLIDLWDCVRHVQKTR